MDGSLCHALILYCITTLWTAKFYGFFEEVHGIRRVDQEAIMEGDT